MNKATFNQTYLPLRQVIFMVCVALLTDQEVANDITQDVYLRLWEQRDELDNVQSPQAYAVRIARNRCLDHLKSAGERLRTSGKEAETALALQIDNSADPHSTLVAKSGEERLAHWVEQLREPQKSIFSLRHYEMLSNQESAERLGLQETTVRSTLSRLRKEVRALFEKD